MSPDPSNMYAVTLDCPHATNPDVLWEIHCHESLRRPLLWVPRLETWTIDTLRLFLHELAAYLPPHEEADVTVKAKTDNPKGRAPADGRPRRRPFNERVEFQIAARGWTAWVWAWRNEVTDKDGQYLGRNPGEWSEPMQAVLLDLAAKSPFPLSNVRVVESAPVDADLKWPSRRDVVRGIEPNAKWSNGHESRKERMKRLIDDILGD